MSDLKPCPFCGGEAESFNPFANTVGTWCVLCSECAAASGFEQTEAEAIAAWNTRAERVTDDEWESYQHSIPATEENMAKFGWVRERTCKQLRIFNLIKRECDGKRYSWHGDEMPNYCPNCGCKVVGE